MKKVTCLVIILLFGAATAPAADHALFSAGVSFLKPADSGFREVYGGQAFYPEAQVGVQLYRGLYLMGGFGMLTKKGRTPELDLPAKSRQYFITAGLAYIANATRTLKLKFEAGVADVSYREEAMDTTVSGSKLGFQAEMGLLIMGEVAFTGLNIGYLSASGTSGDVSFKLGGAKASLCIGFRI